MASLDNTKASAETKGSTENKENKDVANIRKDSQVGGDNNEKNSSSEEKPGSGDSETESVDYEYSGTATLLTANDKEENKDSSPMTLPDTVTVLEGPHGGKVYLVGTAHFSEKSCRDVEEVIRKTKPNIVVLELCRNRVHILEFDEKRILEEVESLGLAKLRASIKEYGLVQGLLTICLLSMTAQMTKQIGMAPGGEFRAAFKEVKKLPGCVLHLGDRPVNITLSRGLSSLHIWSKIKLAYQILANTETITPEEVEKCKEKGLLDQMLGEMANEYPSLSKVFVDERNTYLAYALQLAASPGKESPAKLKPTTVVGVVGIGHVAGIVEKWGKVSDSDIPPLMKIPEASTKDRIIMGGIKYALISLVVYAGYKFLVPKNVKTFFS